jgi:hypothetical protein
MVGSSSYFAGEDFLQYALPDHDAEHSSIVMTAFVTLLCIVYVIPKSYIYFFADGSPRSDDDDNDERDREMGPANNGAAKNSGVGNGKSSDTATTSGKRRDKHGGSKGTGTKGAVANGKNKTVNKTVTTTTESSKKTNFGNGNSIIIGEAEVHVPSATVELPFWVSPPVLTLVGLLFVVYMVWMSSANTFSARGVFEAPLFKPEECDQILDMAYRAANVNYRQAKQQLSNKTKTSELTNLQQTQLKSVLEEPRGWTKDRHAQYPTTDLNVMTDGLTVADRAAIGEWLDARLAPLIGRVFGYKPYVSIRANDMFVVRYDGASDKLDGARFQQHLSLHKDEGCVSFNVLLKDPTKDFEGGGTRFVSQGAQFELMDVFPQTRGNVLLHHASECIVCRA